MRTVIGICVTGLLYIEHHRLGNPTWRQLFRFVRERHRRARDFPHARVRSDGHHVQDLCGPDGCPPEHVELPRARTR